MNEDAIRRVLDGLGKVEAPSGLEGRVLRRLAEQGDRRSTSRGWILGMGLGTAMVLGCVWMAQREFAIPARTVRLSQVRHPHTAFAHPEAEHTPGAKAGIVGAAERPKAEALGYLQATAKARHGAPGSGQAYEMAAGPESFPAPPEPLTEQERLLVRVARHPRAGEVEFLIAEVREAELIRSNAEFDLFFPPPKLSEGTEVSQPVEGKENNNEVQPIVR